MFGRLTNVFGWFTAENLKSLPAKCFWYYVGLMYFFFGIGVWPWIFYQFWDNAQSGGNVIMDWERQPDKSNHTQRLMHDVAMISKPAFEYSMECFGA